MPEYLIFFKDEWVTETTDAGRHQRAHDARAVVAEMRAAGVLLHAGGLDNDGRVFHVAPVAGAPIITDGPYAETKEVIGGFAAIDVADEAAARYWAGRIAVACDWPQEVRTFRTAEQIPTPDADRAAAAREADRAAAAREADRARLRPARLAGPEPDSASSRRGKLSCGRRDARRLPSAPGLAAVAQGRRPG